MLVLGPKEDKILACLEKNKNGFLYQKCGYLFEEFRNDFGFRISFLRNVGRVLLGKAVFDEGSTGNGLL